MPVVLKDNLCTRGVPTTCSSKILSGWVPPYDATVVQRLAAAGAVVVGKTNLDEFAMGSSTENSAFGPTRNPHHLGRVPGGSSGGSAAAVAAGFAAVGLGSDTGGSIRQPAALCGVVGMKPTYGLVSRYGLIAFASSLDQIGPLSRRVADSALLLDVIAGPDPADSTSLRRPPPPARPAGWAKASKGSASVSSASWPQPKGSRLTWWPAPETRLRPWRPRAPRSTRSVSRPRSTACPRTTSSPRPRPPPTWPVTTVFATAFASVGPGTDDITEMYLRTRSAGFGPEVKRRVMLGTYALSAGYYDAYYGKAQQVRTLIIRDFEVAYSRFDVLLAPTAPTTAFELGAKTADPLTMYLNDVCTIPSNLAGHPAISVPFGAGDDGLPVGVQVLAPALGETVMFQVAAALESAAPAMSRPTLAGMVRG